MCEGRDLAQPELGATGWYSVVDDNYFPNFKITLSEVTEYGHGSLILDLTGGLQKYLQMEKLQKEGPKSLRTYYVKIHG